jgi:hypothetical protein
MVLDIQIEAKVAGSSKSFPSTWDVQLPVDTLPPLHCTLKDFIELVVRDEVEAFKERQKERRLNRIMSPEEISSGIQKGKLDPGAREVQQDVNLEDAVHTALQAFTDGLYYVFLNEQQITDLESEILVHDGSQVTFLRLVALAGG